MRNLLTVIRETGRFLLRMEVTLILLLVVMTAAGRAGDLDKRIRLAVTDVLQSYQAGRVIAALDAPEKARAKTGRTTAALPVGR